MRLRVAKKLASEIREGKQAITRAEVKLPSGLGAGDLVELWCGDEFLGLAVANPKSNIRLRVLSLEKDFSPEEVIMTRLEKAKRLREEVLGYEGSYRWVYSEADNLSGVVVDKYEEVAVVQISNPYFDRLRDLVAEELFEVDKELTTVYERNDHRGRLAEGLELRKGLLAGEDKRFTEIREGNAKFLVDFVGGQKTGFFLDQKENRNLFAKLAWGRVLDLFCYTGAFGIRAMLNRCEELWLVEQSRKAISTLERNLELNSLEAKVCRGDAFELVKRFLKAGERFDSIVIDPPAFLQEGRSKHAAMRSYYLINFYAAQLLADEGLLLSCSCSHGVGEQEFRELVLKAVRRAGRKARVLATLGQAPDHPETAFHPELRYLKALFLCVTK